MNEKEKLAELIIQAIDTYATMPLVNGCRPELKYFIADYLLANGVICPPCKVGDTLFYPWVYGGTSGIAILEADAIKSYVQGRSMVFFKNPESDMPMPSYFREEDFGKTVFLSRELAEKALAERSKA